MSGFDENPFGEPNINNDPFADPAVQRAASSIPARGIEDYNPFDNQTGGNVTQVRGASNPPISDTRPTPQGYGAAAATQPAMLQPSSQEAPPPSYTRSAQQTIPQSNSGMFSPTSQPPNEPWRRNTQEMNSPPYYARRNNWPPLPESCCVQPCFYQDIDVEIQTDFQKIVRHLYYLWIFHAFILVLNVFGGFIMMLAGGKSEIFGVGIVYFIIFTPFSFLCWFRPVYQAFKNDSSFNFMVFFFMFFFQTAMTCFQSVGIPDSGTIGVITALTWLEFTSFKGFIIGLLFLIIAAGFVMAAVSDVLLLTQVHRIYRSTGASVTKAQAEFTSTFLRNEHVQGAAAGVASSALRAQVNNMTQPRY